MTSRSPSPSHSSGEPSASFVVSSGNPGTVVAQPTGSTVPEAAMQRMSNRLSQQAITRNVDKFLVNMRDEIEEYFDDDEVNDDFTWWFLSDDKRIRVTVELTKRLGYFTPHKPGAHPW